MSIFAEVVRRNLKPLF